MYLYLHDSRAFHGKIGGWVSNIFKYTKARTIFGVLNFKFQYVFFFFGGGGGGGGQKQCICLSMNILWTFLGDPKMRKGLLFA